ncbi:MAG: hypothetical protein JWL95_2092, partial [Gemmatimonadetes bacterium]|nr:hypothetical protein [Gemmatimonadota bacterium]
MLAAIGALAVVCIVAAQAGAQRRWRVMQEPNTPYDGRYAFVRLSYTV